MVSGMVPCVPLNASRSQPTLSCFSPLYGTRRQFSTLLQADVLCLVYPSCWPSCARRPVLRLNSQRRRVLACNRESELQLMKYTQREDGAEKNSVSGAGIEEQLFITCMGLVAAVLLWCPSSQAFELADAQTAVQSTKVQFERTVISALNWPFTRGGQQLGASLGDGGSQQQDGWHLPRPDQLLQSFSTKDGPSSVSAPPPSGVTAKVKTDQPQAKRDDTEREKEKARKEKEKKEKDDLKAKAAKEQEQIRRLEKQKRELENQERELRDLERRMALYGGGAVGLGLLGFAKWQTILTVSALVFRSLGGPNIISGVLRTAGYIFGKQIRAVEWDVEESPKYPNGRMVSFTLRTFTSEGLKKAIATHTSLQSPDVVKQTRHWIQTGPIIFYEPLGTPMSFRLLADPALVVWSRHPDTRSADKIPDRGDEWGSGKRNAVPANLSKDQEVVLMLRCISAVAAASREQCPSPASGAFMHHELVEDTGPRVLGGAAVNVVVELGPTGEPGPGWGLTPGQLGGHALVSGTSTIKGLASEAPRLASHVVNAMDRRTLSRHSPMGPVDAENVPATLPSPPHSSASGHSASEPADKAKMQPAKVSVTGSTGTQRTGIWSLLGPFRWRSGSPSPSQPSGHNAPHRGSISNQHTTAVPAEEDEAASSCTCSANCSRDDAFACRGGSKVPGSPQSEVDRRLHQLMQRLTFPREFTAITGAEEDDLVRKAVTEVDPYLAIFQAYGESDPAIFMRFARVLCAGGHSTHSAVHEG